MSKAVALISGEKLDLLKLAEHYGVTILWEQPQPKTDDNEKIDSQPNRQFVDVTINSLSDTPSVQFEAGEDNTISVDDFEYIDGACATQNVSLLGRTILMNICDDGNGPSIKLDIELDGKFLKQVPFKLNKDGKNTISL